MIYLFKCRNNSEDVFEKLFNKMTKSGFNCIRLIDEENNDPSIIKSLIGKETTLISSDHINISPNNGYSIIELVELLKPKKFYYSIHDLAINDVGFDKKLLPKNTIILSPGEPWNSLYESINENIITVGFPKFTEIAKNKKDTLFAASLIYVYAERNPQSFINDYKWIFENNITIKFPDCELSKKLINKLNYNNTILKGSTFDLMQNYKTVITNSSSSICVEAAICGCKSINLGARISKIYNKFNIHFMKPKDLYNTKINSITSKTHKEYLFDIDKTISILTQHTT